MSYFEVTQDGKCSECKYAATSPSVMPCRDCGVGGEYFWQPEPVQEVDAFTKPEQQQKLNDGSTADYYNLPPGATELQDLISFKNMNAQVGEAFRSLYRFDNCPHSDKSRNARKVIYYMQAELDRLEKYDN